MTPLVSGTQDLRSPLDAAVFSRSRGDDARQDFSAVLGKVQKKDGETAESYARRSAETLVSISLIQPLLKKLRESSQAAPPFAPTEGERQFQGMADSALAERMAHSANFQLVDAIATKLMERSRSGAGRTDVPGPSPSSESRSDDPESTKVTEATQRAQREDFVRGGPNR